MATRYSTGAVEALGGVGRNHAFFGTNISFTESTKTILSGSNAFTTRIKAGDELRVLGSSLNDGTYSVATVAADGSGVTVVEDLVDEVAGTKLAIVCFSQGGSFVEVFRNAVGAFYTGNQPANGDAIETGTLLGYLTRDGLPFSAGQPANGLNWNDSINGESIKPGAENWICNPIANGNVGYLRLYNNDFVTGESNSAIRVDLACGVGTGELRFTSLVFAVGVPVPCNGLTGVVTKNPRSV
jgi:hypothetical protein